ncbi:hypothetical protein [Variovorax sp. LT1R16]|uniref:hypothetical protein n=1 Tax=Variovorax sp. LT1R16 TaxID=3443728 RepID=UPI003F4917DC
MAGLSRTHEASPMAWKMTDAYGKNGVRFHTKQKSIMLRRPESIGKGAEFVMPRR